MDLRLASTLVLLLGAAAAQTPAPATPPAPAQPAAPAPAQDPDKPSPTPAQQAEALAAEKVRLEAEIAYARTRAANAKQILADKLAPKGKTWKAIDAGVMASPVQTLPAATQPRTARVASKDELADLGADVLLAVNGRPIPQAAFDELMAHLAKSQASGDESMRAQRALFDLIRIEAVASQFQDNEAAERTGDLIGQLDAGTAIADLAKSVGTVAGAGPDGKLEVTRNSIHGPRFEQVAFATEAGKRARPFRNAYGLVILHVDSHVKGDTPDGDKVIVQTIQVPYSPDAQALAKVHNAVNFGQIDVVARDDATLAMLPEMFRRQQTIQVAAPPEAGRDTQALQQALQQIAAEIAGLQGKDDDESKRRLAALETRYAEMKRALREPPAAAGDDQAPLPVPKTEGGQHPPAVQPPAPPAPPKAGEKPKQGKQ